MIRVVKSLAGGTLLGAVAGTSFLIDFSHTALVKIIKNSVDINETQHFNLVIKTNSRNLMRILRNQMSVLIKSIEIFLEKQIPISQNDLSIG